MSRSLVSFLVCLSLCIPAAALGKDFSSTAREEIGRPVKIKLDPEQILLLGPRSRQQILVTGVYDDGQLRDLTGLVPLASTNPQVARLEGKIVMPVGNGECQIVAVVDQWAAMIPCSVRQFDKPQPVSFKNETLMALTKAGCNMGACHGSPSGKGGFRLSLRAYDPDLDIMTLRQEFFGRRTNILVPSDSLLLKKPLMEVAHGGGQRLKRGDLCHQVLERWIAEGMKIDTSEEPDLVRIEVTPAQRVLHAPARQQQLMVTGYFSDGSVRDLTGLADYTSSNEAVAKVSPQGLVTREGRGETTILVRYLDKMITCPLTFLEPVPGFVWQEIATHNFIDEHVFSRLKSLQILPSELCTDEEFLRRVYLDITGRLPSIEEAHHWLNQQHPRKRELLINELLESEDYAQFWATKWCDLLRVTSKKLKPAGVHKFRLWVYEQIRRDVPLDQFARELLTAQGSVYENPAANYWRASRDPQDATETTAQLFLGIRIQCAKCHNHPFERWTQDNYYGIAAAFARIGRKGTADPDEEIIFVAGGGEVTQPRTGRLMKVHLPLRGDVEVPAGQDRRVVFADWLTQPQNPFFNKSVVNRIWGHMFGRGLVEPVDDFRDSNPAAHPALLEELAKQFAAYGCSQKWAIRTIATSRVYQLSSQTNPFNEHDEQYFSHALTRLLTAEQLLDAICAVTGVAENFAGVPPGMRASELPEPPANHDFLKVFGQPPREMACQCERSNESSLSQALQMINGPVVHQKLRADHGRIAKMIAEGDDDIQIISSLYLAAVSRAPTPQELQLALQHVQSQQDRRMALEDIGWAILNSKEFLFQH